MSKPQSMDKKVQSYGRLLKSGIISKEIYDKRIQNRVPPLKSQPNAPIQNKPSTNHTQNIIPPSSQNKPSTNHTQNIIAPPSQKNTKPVGNSLASHIISRGPISNLSGQYPMNGAPGTSLR